MHIGKSYKPLEFLFWTRRNIFWLLLLGTIPTVLYQMFDCKWLAIPWPVVAMLGTATAFIVGFKNVQTYNRTWEARQIWGAAMSASRSWALMCRDFIEDADKSKAIIYRHFAWLTALRYQLRTSRSWETTDKSYNKEYKQFYAIPEKEISLEEELSKYMYTMNDQHKADTVLFDLVGTIQNFSDSMYTYLHHIGELEVLNPFQKLDSISINEPLPCEFFERFGIRRLILNAFSSGLAISDHCRIEHDKKNIISRNWNKIKNDVSLEELKTLFRSCDIIQFADWTCTCNASDIWDGLLSDVIRPLNKKDFHFIFYLGDPSERLVFETDEILDIISEYSSYGKVTLVLDENEADRLWSILNGWNPGLTHFSYQSESAIEKYLSIFNTMRIDVLVIFSVNCTVLLCYFLMRYLSTLLELCILTILLRVKFPFQV